MRPTKKILIFLGVPGSGKGTQAKKIAELHNYIHISTGNLLRSLEGREDMDVDLHQGLADMQAGKLVSDTVIYRLAFDAIEKNMREGRGVVLDGAIRSVAQAEEYQNFFEKHGWDGEVMVIELALTDELARERLFKRGEFARAGKAVPGTSDIEAVRSDDMPHVIEDRLRAQGNAVIQPIVRYYESLGCLKRVDGEKNIEEVEMQLQEILNDV